MEAYERIFLWLAAAMLVIFLAALAYTATAMGISVVPVGQMIIAQPGRKLRTVVRATPPFDHPGLRQIAAGRYEAVVIGQSWAFTPSEIDVPRGAEVTFRATSADVTHGLYIAGTHVNMMLIPGYVSVMTYHFTEPGEYLMLCHEYCGLLHHTMAGKVVVR